MQLQRSASGFTLIEAILVVVIIFIIATIAVPASTELRQKVAVSSACETAKIIQAALAGYTSANQYDAYPTTQEAHNWAEFRSACADHGASLAETLILQGLSFFQYHGLTDAGKDCDNSGPETACSQYYIVMRALNVHGDQEGAQLEVTASGILRQSY